ncbi:MAG: hypothetical protein INF91_12110 [Alphaproteobacteria bacterium]|nr:hypothetical protein [Alphaproteobacteria bacterium]
MTGSQSTLDKALAKVAAAEAEVVKYKQFVNMICELDGREPMFSVEELRVGGAQQGGGSGLRFAPDAFFGKPFATAVREILTARKSAGVVAPASVDDIYDALKAGGFGFPSNDPEKQKMGLAVSLGKNTVTFRKLPNGLYGLAEWYGGGVRSSQSRRRRAIDLGEENEADDAETIEVSEQDEAAGPLLLGGPAASLSTPNSADEDGREVAHDNMTP